LTVFWRDLMAIFWNNARFYRLIGRSRAIG
jgi:hypothetical protein